MAKTSIEYCDEVSNFLYARPIGDESVKVGTFCEKPDPEGTCKNCWAEALNKRFGNGFAFDRANRDRIEWLPRPAEVLRLQRLNARNPISAKFPGYPLVVFTNDTYDLFQPSISDQQRDWVFDELDRLENLTLLVQTTYVSRMSRYLRNRYPDGMPRHYIVGMSAGNQKFLDDNVEHLLAAPAPRRYVIFEPLLGAVSFRRYMRSFDSRREFHTHGRVVVVERPGVDWIIVGCESGSKRRPMKREWLETIRDEIRCSMGGCQLLVKQMVISGKVCGEIRQFPKDLQVREFPYRNAME
jgi:protein gp37